MYIGPTQLLLNAVYGTTKPSKVETNIYQTLSAELSGKLDPYTSTSLTSSLLALSTAEPSGLTMFDVLAQSYGLGSSRTNLLAAYKK
jgi:hypothetical protein